MSAVESLPAGFRFHPTDEELIVYYLSNRVASVPCPVRIVAEVDIYKFDPWDLPSRAMYGEKEWYFFSPRDRKYPNGARPNRAAGSGYWKATGTDKPILSSKTNKSVGVKKALVFYMGKPPKGVKSEWIMHEYRLTDNSSKSRNNSSGKQKHSMRLDDWVLCRIYKKSNSQTSDNSSSHEAPQEEEEQSVTEDPNLNPLSFPYPNPYYAPVNSNITPDASFTLPKSSSLANLLESFDSIDHPSLSRLFDGSDLPGLELGFSSSTNQKLLNQQFVMSGGDDFETKDESFGGEVCQADQCSASKRLKTEKTGTRDCSQFNNFAAAGNHHLMNNQNLLFNYQFGLN